MILLDTNVWSTLNRAAEHPRVCDWIAEHVADIWLSTIVIGEIRAGVENPKAVAKRPALARWLADIELTYAERTLPFDTLAAHAFGELIVRGKLEKQETKLLDLQIAAQGLAHGCLVATRNVKDFGWTGVKLVNPWDEQFPIRRPAR